MNKIFLIIQREFLNRVQKKSFLIATILIPLIFPAIIGILVYVSKQSQEGAAKKTIHFVDESKIFNPDTSKYVFKRFDGSFAQGKLAYDNSKDFGFLHIPEINISNPKGITLYTESSPSFEDLGNIENMIETQIKDLKMQKLNIDQKTLDSLKTDITLNTVTGKGLEEKSSNTALLGGLGMAAGILMYMFIFIYGAQIMQGVIEEKTSKVIEVIVSSVRPFQLMMGKILGLASVGLLQFLIWMILMFTLTFGVLKSLGVEPPQKQAMEQMGGEVAIKQASSNSGLVNVLNESRELPWVYIIGVFLFYFLGGYLIYGALFAAVGSAVDSPAEAQQFMFPITIPLLISYMSLFMFVLKDHDSTISIWLSIIPLTSPIAMMGRIGFGVPPWQLALSMILLIGGFLGTTWIAGRIYRVGILMHGTKVNYKVLAKWFMQRG
ncbi:ABC transporter permease [soil metagenome]